MNEPWSIQLLGGLRIRQSGRVITRFRTQKTGALLAYLAYHRQQSHAREVLGELFWPDATLESSRHSLSQALTSLRSQLEPPGLPAGSVIVADRFSVELNPEAYTTDAGDFETALRIATQARKTPEQIPLLSQALLAYKGVLLPDYYEDWIEKQRERLAQRFQQASIELIALLERAGNRELGLEIAERALSLDPLREEANREVIRLLVGTGQNEAALRQYHAYERLLSEELGSSPGSALRLFVRQIEAEMALHRAPLNLASRTADPRTRATPPRRTPPTGTVTFLATDSDDTTDLHDGEPAAFASALSLLRREFRRHGGQEVNETNGRVGSFLVVFASVGDALACSISCQQNREYGPEGEGRFPMRIALDSGDVDLLEGAYEGAILHHVARMRAIAQTGQIICSEATAGLLKRDLDAPVSLKDLGVWRLQEKDEPERIFQAVYPGMAIPEFPPLRAIPAHSPHLPLQFTRFFGREDEIGGR